MKYLPNNGLKYLFTGSHTLPSLSLRFFYPFPRQRACSQANIQRQSLLTRYYSIKDSLSNPCYTCDLLARCNQLLSPQNCSNTRTTSIAICWESTRRHSGAPIENHCSEPLKHSTVERILVLKRQIQAYFYPLRICHLFGYSS